MNDWAGPPWARRGGMPLPLRLFLIVVIGWIQIVGTTFAAHDQVGREALDALAYTLLAVGPVSLLWRRRYPVPVLGLTFGATLLYWLLDYPEGPVFLALAIAFVTAIMKGHRAAAAITAVIGYVGFFFGPYFLGNRSLPSWGEALAASAWLLVLFVGAEMARTRRQQAIEARRHRVEERRRREADERLRIARELHDVLAHNISLINVQAGVALHLMDEDPEQARSALAAIKEASRGALNEVRSVLGVLRRVDEDLPRAPAPSLARLDELVESVTGAGIEVRTETSGTPHPLPANVDLAAFRIVQEALTNVARHARPATATVRVTYGPDDVTVQIEDDGQGGPASGSGGSGSGIAGMRERAAALRGDFEAAPRPGGGFRVWARLPIGAQS